MVEVIKTRQQDFNKTLKSRKNSISSQIHWKLDSGEMSMKNPVKDLNPYNDNILEIQRIVNKNYQLEYLCKSKLKCNGKNLIRFKNEKFPFTLPRLLQTRELKYSLSVKSLLVI